MKAFHVPADLAALDLSLPQVRAIINARQRKRVLENRLASLPIKAEHLRERIIEVAELEQKLMDRAQANGVEE